MFLLNYFKKATVHKGEDTDAIGRGDSENKTEGNNEKIQKELLNDALAKAALRQITPFGTIYW